MIFQEQNTDARRDRFHNFWRNSPCVIIDGALGTELERRGSELDRQLWSAAVLMSNPNAIRQLHKDYFSSGANICITSSYQLSFEVLSNRGHNESEITSLFNKSVQLCQEAAIEAGGDFFIAGSVGCFGAHLAEGQEYSGRYDISDSDLTQFHARVIRTLWSAGCDLLACETIPSATEAVAVIRALQMVKGSLAWISLSLNDSTHLNNGDSLEECVRMIVELDVDRQVIGIGINCSAPDLISNAIDIIRQVMEQTESDVKRRIVVYPNTGEVWQAEARSWLPPCSCSLNVDNLDVDFATQALEWRNRGAGAIGGCCRTRPSTIAAIAKVLQKT